MADDFPLILKGSIDKLVSQKATALLAEHPTLRWAEVDDMMQTDEVFKGEGPAILWQFGSLYEHPRAPLYGVEFTVGAKTVSDPGNYLLIELLGEIRDQFKPDGSFQLFDYVRTNAEPVDSVSKGFLRVCSNEIAPQQFDRQSGIRYAVVRCKAVRYG